MLNLSPAIYFPFRTQMIGRKSLYIFNSVIFYNIQCLTQYVIYLDECAKDTLKKSMLNQC